MQFPQLNITEYNRLGNIGVEELLNISQKNSKEMDFIITPESILSQP